MTKNRRKIPVFPKCDSRERRKQFVGKHQKATIKSPRWDNERKGKRIREKQKCAVVRSAGRTVWNETSEGTN